MFAKGSTKTAQMPPHIHKGLAGRVMGRACYRKTSQNKQIFSPCKKCGLTRFLSINVSFSISGIQQHFSMTNWLYLEAGTFLSVTMISSF